MAAGSSAPELFTSVIGDDTHNLTYFAEISCNCVMYTHHTVNNQLVITYCLISVPVPQECSSLKETLGSAPSWAQPSSTFSALLECVGYSLYRYSTHAQTHSNVRVSLT